MTESVPIWVTLTLGLVPIVTALIAGLFTRLNTVEKKIDRLSKLVELREKVSEPINPGSALDKIIPRVMELIGAESEVIADLAFKWLNAGKSRKRRRASFPKPGGFDKYRTGSAPG